MTGAGILFPGLTRSFCYHSVHRCVNGMFPGMMTAGA